MRSIVAAIGAGLAMLLSWGGQAYADIPVEDSYSCQFDGTATLDQSRDPLPGTAVETHSVSWTFSWKCAHVDIDGAAHQGDPVDDTGVDTGSASGTGVYSDVLCGLAIRLTTKMTLPTGRTESPLSVVWTSVGLVDYGAGGNQLMVIDSASDADSPKGRGAGVLEWTAERNDDCIMGGLKNLHVTGAFTVEVGEV